MNCIKTYLNYCNITHQVLNNYIPNLNKLKREKDYLLMILLS